VNRLALLIGALLWLFAASNAASQVPHVQVFLEGDPSTNTYSRTEEVCKPPGTIQDAFVVFQSFGMFIWAVEFSIDYPPALLHAEDVYPPDALTIGTSNANNGTGGIAIAWFNPQNAFDPFLALRVRLIWTSNCFCGGSGGGTQVMRVRGYQYQLALNNNGGQLHPRVVRWPDFAEIEGVGLDSYICSTRSVPVETTTWGRVKALYR
jgi:hypothetical protein